MKVKQVINCIAINANKWEYKIQNYYYIILKY